MTDVYDKTTRSAVMQKVRSKGNKSTELRLIEIFKVYGITGWKRNYPIKGHPDFSFVNKKNCRFWHGHNCRNTRPKENEEYWTKKRKYNKVHDKIISSIFKSCGWTVIRIWECELNKRNHSKLINKINNLLK